MLVTLPLGEVAAACNNATKSLDAVLADSMLFLVHMRAISNTIDMMQYLQYDYARRTQHMVWLSTSSVHSIQYNGIMDLLLSVAAPCTEEYKSW